MLFELFSDIKAALMFSNFQPPLLKFNTLHLEKKESKKIVLLPTKD